jgi:hypothetical protein
MMDHWYSFHLVLKNNSRLFVHVNQSLKFYCRIKLCCTRYISLCFHFIIQVCWMGIVSSNKLISKLHNMQRIHFHFMNTSNKLYLDML